jgi:hypothetical protein
MLDALAYAGMQLEKGGFDGKNTPTEQLQTALPLSRTHASTLRGLGVYSIGDITTYEGQINRWRDLRETLLHFLNGYELPDEPPPGPPPLAIHSTWLSPDTSVVEILGYTEEEGQVCIRIWVPVTEGIGSGTLLKIHAQTPSRGAGSPLSAPLTAIFTGDLAVRIFTHPDEIILLDGNPMILYQQTQNISPVSSVPRNQINQVSDLEINLIAFTVRSC